MNNFITYNDLVNELERLFAIANCVYNNVKIKLIDMKKNKIIVGSIFFLWALIIGSYFIDSWIYEEIVLWVFISPILLGLLYAIYVGVVILVRNFKNK